MSDQVANAIKVTVSGTYDADDVTITLETGHGAELPDPSGDNYNLIWWDSTNYGDAVDDPDLEIIRVTAKAGDVITVTRAQEGTGASLKSTSAATYKMVLGVTAKTITDLIAETDVIGAGLTFHMSDTSTHGVAEIADVATVSAEIDADIATHASNGNAHHAEAHSIASHNDTTATGAELEDLTDGSDADALHAHGANDTHRASTANPHAVTKAQVGLGDVLDILDNFSAIVAPTVNEDSGDGYDIGSVWIDTVLDQAYICLDDTLAAAVWSEVTLPTHALGGASHTADTLANLNAKVSDATLIDTVDSRLSDARTPTAHETSHEATGSDELDFDELADGTTYKKLLATERTKLTGIETGAEVNNISDVNATDLTDFGNSSVHYHNTDRARNAHTGTQASSTITALATARILGRKTAGAGVIEELTAADVLTMIGVESGADVTDATNVDSAGAVMESDYDAQTILRATSDDTPTTLTVAEQTLIGRLTAGNISALTPTQIRALLNIEDGSTADQSGAEIKTAYEAEADTNAYNDAAVTKLAGIEAAADVTDTANVNSAGAVMNTDKDVINGVVGIDASGDVNIITNLQGNVINNLNAFDFGERILGLMTSPVFLNVMCEDPGVGTLTDISGNDHDGTYTGTWITAQRLKQGRTWKLNPNGTDNYITLGDDDDFSFGDGSNDSTVTFFGMIEVVNAGFQMIITKHNATTGSELREWVVDLTSDEKIKVIFTDESANVSCDRITDAALSVGKHSLIVTYDGAGGATAANTIKIYVDGILIASTATNDASYVAMENLATSVVIGACIGVGGTIGTFMTGDIGCIGIDASEWTVAKANRFHQLCLANYSEDGISL